LTKLRLYFKEKRILVEVLEWVHCRRQEANIKKEVTEISLK
jgi:hypothetical protein